MKVVILVAALPIRPAVAGPVLGVTLVGQCTMTRVADVGQRMGKGSGSSVRLTNGVDGVSYDEVPAVNASRVGDRVRVCLVDVPRHCPKGDDRGRVYKTINLRTHRSWTLPDAEHVCGGA